MRRRVPMILLLAALLAGVSHAAAAGPCEGGTVFEDRNGNGRRDAGEPGIRGVKVSDGTTLAVTDVDGAYRLPPVDGQTLFVIKPAGYLSTEQSGGLPDLWQNTRTTQGPALRYGGMPVQPAACRDFALLTAKPSPDRQQGLDVLVFADPQAKSARDVDYYRRDIVEPLMRETAIDMGHSFGPFYFKGLAGDLGISLGDITNDDLSLYPSLIAATARLGVPWLHVAGNHDLDFDATRDEDSLLTFRHHFGPDTHAWEEPEATFVLLDDVIYQPGRKPAYIGGLREDQFAFLEHYLPTLPRDRLLVIAVHIPFFDAEPGRETFRRADRERLFGMLRAFPKVLLLSGHSHTQRHVYHGAASGWHGASPLHEYNVGAACGAFWSGVKDAQGIPDTTMADGTPNGYARLRVARGGDYQLSWHPARPPSGDVATTTAMRLSAPKVLRKGAWPAFAVHANVYMGQDDSRVEYRVDGGEWRPMQRVAAPDPWLAAQNLLDDRAEALRGYDRAPPAEPSPHLWRGTLPTHLAVGEHAVEVRVFDRWQGEQRASLRYRLEEAPE